MPQTPDLKIALAGLLQRGGVEMESTVLGGSMGAALPSGTRIRITCAAGANYKDGAVIAFFMGSTLVGHRVVGRSRDLRGRPALLTRGDAQLFCDPPIDPSVVLGEVTARETDSHWHSVPVPLRSGVLDCAIAKLGLTTVRALARLDRDLASRLVEAIIVTLRRVRHAARLLAGTPG